MNQNSSLNQNLQTQQKFSRDIMKISDHQLGIKFRSKLDIYTYLTQTCKTFFDDFNKLYLPPKEFALYQKAIDYEKQKKYFPNIKKKPMDREYFFNILNTVYPEYTKSLISLAQNSRVNPELYEEKKDYILISDEWYNKLMSHPFISKKPGKTIQQLKESTKILKDRIQNLRKNLDYTLKRFRGMKNAQHISGKENNSH